MKSYPQKDFAHPVVAVDVVIFTIIKQKLNVLLLQLSEQPYVDKYALPGGLVSNSETLEESVVRHLQHKTGLKNAYSEQIYTFGDPNRDPHGWVVSVAYMSLIAENDVLLKTSDRYKDISWHPVSDLPSLAYDHKQIIETAVTRLKSKLGYTNIVYTLLPKEFTLSELQEVYEIILGETLDKRNFRKKINSLSIVEELGRKTSGGAHRPAMLYKFTSSSLQQIDILS